MLLSALQAVCENKKMQGFKSTHLIKDININLLKTVGATKLIDLMMNFIIYPYVIIIHTIVDQGVIHIFFAEAIDNLKVASLSTKMKNMKI